MQKDTKLRILGFFGPLILGIGFAVEAIYYVAFAWWLDPWLARKSNRELVDDIKTNLDFLSSESSSIRVLPADWPTVEIPWGNLLFTIVRWRGDTIVSVAPRHAPAESHELGPLIAAIECRHFSEHDFVNDLVDAAKLLRPRLQVLTEAFSEQQDGQPQHVAAMTVADCDGNGCLMDVEPNRLFAVHEGAPFVGDDACALITYSKRGALL